MPENVTAPPGRESYDTQREKSLYNYLSPYRPYTPIDYVDNNVEHITTPFSCFQREKKPPEIFAFKKKGYHVARSMMKAINRGVITGGVTYYQYIHGILLNNDGTLSKSLLHYHLIFNTSKKWLRHSNTSRSYGSNTQGGVQGIHEQGDSILRRGKKLEPNGKK